MSTLNIGINGLYINWGVNAGTETYLTNIILPWYENDPGSVFFRLYCNSPPTWYRGPKPWFEIVELPWSRRLPLRILAEQVLLPISSFRSLHALFHPGYVGSLTAGVAQIVTVHDAFAWLFPEEIGTLRATYWRKLIPPSLRRARRVIAVSRSTAQDIQKFAHISAEKVTTIHEAGSHLVNSKEVFEENRTRGYFHCVGFFKEIKNPWRVLEAYKIYSKNNHRPKQLFLAGGVHGKQAMKIAKYAETLDNVRILGRVTDDELRELYIHSAGLLFPSLYEGFGIPILEAQSLGCPVITSNTSSMPEVAGPAASFVNPESVDEIISALNELDAVPSRTTIQLGYENAQSFSWDKASQQTLDVLKQEATQ